MDKSYYRFPIKVLDNIWQVGGNDLTGSGDAAVFLVCFNDQAAIIDAGCGGEHKQLIDNIFACLPQDTPISHLLLTHCHYDHTGGADTIRKEFGCLIVCHELDAVYLENGDSAVTAASWYGATIKPFLVDIKINQKTTRIAIGNGEITAYHCPGHSPGSMVFLVEKEGKKILFGQDIHGPIHSMLLSNRNDYLHSLKWIMELDADILCEGHFGIFHGKNEVRRFIGSYLY